MFFGCLALLFINGITCAEPDVETDPMTFNFQQEDLTKFWGYGNGVVTYGPDGATMNFDINNRNEKVVRIQSKKRYFQGHFSAIMKTADCSPQPNAGLNTGYFVFFNNQSDTNQNGLIDNSEIDFEFLCGDPSLVYISIYTDFEDRRVQYKTYRLVNIRTGTVVTSYRVENTTWTRIPTTDTFTPIPNFDPGLKFYEYGFDWLPTGVNFWMRDLDDPDTVLELWNYTAPAGIVLPSSPAYYLATLRQTTWAPPTNPTATEWPTFDPKVYIKEYKYIPYDPNTVTNNAILANEIQQVPANLDDLPKNTKTEEKLDMKKYMIIGVSVVIAAIGSVMIAKVIKRKDNISPKENRDIEL